MCGYIMGGETSPVNLQTMCAKSESGFRLGKSLEDYSCSMGRVHGFSRIPIVTTDDETTPKLLTSNGFAVYRHDSGFRVILYHAPGPLYDGCIVVPTLPVGDGGHPHTLEHLCFLGTDRYARGYLDALAVHSLGEGTNAWTAVDHTAYTATTAGLAGFLQVFPVLLEHVINPRLDAAAFTSEVYHVRGDGSEAGVVFCEMSGCEHTEDAMLDRNIRKVLYEGTALAMEYGGSSSAIRTLRPAEISAFHAQYYHLSNVTAIVGGQNLAEGPEAVLKALQEVLLISYPFHSEIPATPSVELSFPKQSLKDTNLTTLMRKRISFPSADELFGSVTLCWNGPDLSEVREILALNIMLNYLAENVSSPLNQRFVETQKPLSSMIYYYVELYPVTAVVLTFSGVPVQDYDDKSDDETSSASATINTGDNLLEDGVFSNQVIEFLSQFVRDGISFPGGIESVRHCVENVRVQFLSTIENHPAVVVKNHVIADLAHNDNGAPLGRRLCEQLKYFDGLAEEEITFWAALLQRYLLSNIRGEIIMLPDCGLAKRISEEEERVLQDRISRLGTERLGVIEEETRRLLESVKTPKFRSKDFPAELDVFAVPRIPYSETLSQKSLFSVQKLGLDSSFVEATIIWNTASLKHHHKRCLPLLSEIVLNMDVSGPGGSIIPYAKVAEDIASVTTFAYADCCEGSISGEVFVVGFGALPARFEEACRWIAQAVFASFVTKERILAVAQNLMADFQENLRDGSCVRDVAASFVSRTERDAVYSTLVQLPFLEKVSETVRNDRVNSVADLFQAAWNAVRNLEQSATFVQVVSKDPDESLKTLTQAWAKFCPPDSFRSLGLGMEEELLADRMDLPIRSTQWPMLEFGQSGKGLIVGVPGVEKAFVTAWLKVFVSPVHADWAPLEVLLELLGRTAGPIYSAVRDKGLAYGIDLVNKYRQSRLTVNINESAVPADAWDAFSKVIDEFGEQLGDETDNSMDEMVTDLELAKKGLLYKLLQEKKAPSSIGTSALKAASWGMPAGDSAGHTTEEAVERVGLDLVRKMFNWYFRNFLSSSGRLVIVVCSPASVTQNIKSFENSQYPVILTESSVEELLVSAQDIFHSSR